MVEQDDIYINRKISEGKMTLSDVEKRLHGVNLNDKVLGIKKEDEIHYAVFLPGNKSMKQDYHELATIDEFKDLIDKELRFVWYYANKTSAFSKMTPALKIKKCIESAFGKSLSEERYNNYLNGEFEDYIKVAIEKMQSFNPSVRLRSYLAAHATLSNIEAMISVDSDNLFAMEPDEKAKYIKMAKDASDLIPSLIAQIEDAYGVKILSKYKKSSGSESSDVSLMDKVINSQK